MSVFDIRYKHINYREEVEFEEGIRRSVNFKYSLIDGMKMRKNSCIEEMPWKEDKYKVHKFEKKDIPKSFYRLLNSYWNRLNKRRPIIKDPLALLSAEYIAQTFDAHVVVIVRHPAAFVESALRRLSDQVNAIGQLRDCQPEVVASLLQPFEKDIRSWRPDLPLIEQTTLFWRCFNHVVREYQNCNQEWKIVRHEDLVADPRDEFRTLYEELNLDWSRSIGDRIFEGTDKRVNERWKSKLTDTQVEYIYKNAEDVWRSFYEEPEWE